MFGRKVIFSSSWVIPKIVVFFVLLVASVNAISAPDIPIIDGDAVRCKDFGAIVDDGKDDSEAVCRALDYIAKHKLHRLLFEKGQYDFFQEVSEKEKTQPSRDPSRWVFFLNRVDRLEICGNETKFLFHGLRFLLYAKDCHNITVKGLTIDYDRPFFSVGKVVAQANDKLNFDIDIDSAYPVKGGEKVLGLVEMDPVNAIPAASGLSVHYSVTRTELVAPQRLRIFQNRPIAVKPGTMLLLRHELYAGNVFRFMHSKDIRLEDINIHMAPTIVVVCQYTDNFTAQNVNIVPAPGSPSKMSIASDGFNFHSCSGRILVDNCRFDGMGDDAINFFTSFYWSIRQQNAPRSCVMDIERQGSREIPQFQPGDMVDFLDDQLRIYASREIVSCQPDLSNNTSVVVFKEDIPPFTRGKNLLMKHNELQRVIISNSFFRPLRGNGIIIQVPNVTIENNRFVDCAFSGIHITTSVSPWFEAGPVDNLIIRNNEFNNCMRTGSGVRSSVIGTDAELRADQGKKIGELSLRGVHRNIKILNNKIIRSNNGGIVIGSAENVEIRGNLLEDLSLAPRATWATNYWWSRNAITLIGAHNVLFEDNRYVGSGEKKGLLLIGEGCDDSNIKMSDNTGFDVRHGTALSSK